MFQITEFIEATIASVTNRIEKHGDDDVPAVSLTVAITAANTMLDQIDPGIRQALYKAVEGQDQLPGVEPATPVLRCNSFDTVSLTTSHEGWTLQVDDNIDESDPMVFGGVKVDKFKVDAKQGGSVVIKFRLGTSDVDSERLGQLAMHNGREIWIKLLAPEKKPDAIDGTPEAFKADHPDATDATDLFAAGAEQPAGEPVDDEDAGPDLEDRLDNALSAADAEQAEIEAGMRESLAAAGVKPSRRGRKTAASVE